MQYEDKLKLWLENATEDPDLIEELESVKNDEEAVADRFYKDLEFGTGGLRGVIGAGSNRMNVYTVARATQALSEYVCAVGGKSVAIAHDCRIKADLFAKTAARVFAANGLKVYTYSELMPTPMLSWAVRALGCAAGIVITASHNPSKYNGYKAYGPDGCQLNLDASEQVIELAGKVDIFGGVKYTDYDKALENGDIEIISDEIIEEYLDAVAECAVCPDVLKETDLKVIYTPLHGAGNKPVQAILKKIGVKSVSVVESQREPDGRFPTLPFPNPEFKEAFTEAIKVAKTTPADILLATDPDADRVGVAVNTGDDYTLITGNEMGVLMLNYILSVKKQLGTLPKNPIAVTTIVSTDLVKKIAPEYNCSIIETLTGFKFIGEQIALLEEKNEENRFMLGFEESYGYLGGSYVRDKDAVFASMMICEMAAYYKRQGKTLCDVIQSIYEKYGFFLHSQLNFTCEGITGMQKMNQTMSDLRDKIPETIGGLKVEAFSDYKASEKTDIKTGEKTALTLPKSDVLCYSLANMASAIVRPSGTEPKIKVYVAAVGKTGAEAEKIEKAIAEDMTNLLGL
mgnify:FL=1